MKLDKTIESIISRHYKGIVINPSRLSGYVLGAPFLICAQGHELSWSGPVYTHLFYFSVSRWTFCLDPTKNNSYALFHYGTLRNILHTFQPVALTFPKKVVNQRDLQFFDQQHCHTSKNGGHIRATFIGWTLGYDTVSCVGSLSRILVLRWKKKKAKVVVSTIISFYSLWAFIFGARLYSLVARFLQHF